MNQIKITRGQRKVSNAFVFLSILDRRQLIKESPQDRATVRNNQAFFSFKSLSGSPAWARESCENLTISF